MTYFAANDRFRAWSVSAEVAGLAGKHCSSCQCTFNAAGYALESEQARTVVDDSMWLFHFTSAIQLPPQDKTECCSHLCSQISILHSLSQASPIRLLRLEPSKCIVSDIQ